MFNSMSKAQLSRQHIASAFQKMREGDYYSAITEWLTAIELQPDHPEIHTGFDILGSCYARVNDLEKAIEAYKEAIRRKPDYLQSHSGLAGVLAVHGDLKLALDEYLFVLRRSDNRELLNLIRNGIRLLIINAQKQGQVGILRNLGSESQRLLLDVMDDQTRQLFFGLISP